MRLFARSDVVHKSEILESSAESQVWRRRTGIEPARGRIDPSPVLKTGGPTRRPDASLMRIRRLGQADA